MSVSDQTLMIGIGALINYLVIYQKWKFLGNITFASLGIMSMYYGTQLGSGQSDVVFTGIGLVLLLAGIISTILDFLPHKKKNTNTRRYIVR